MLLVKLLGVKSPYRPEQLEFRCYHGLIHDITEVCWGKWSSVQIGELGRALVGHPHIQDLGKITKGTLRKPFFVMLE